MGTPELGEIVFASALGWCRLSWTDRGLLELDLSLEGKASDQMAAMPQPARGHFALEAVELVRAYLMGKVMDFAGLPVDFNGLPAFTVRVLEVVRRIPYGKTMTYGEVAAALGKPGAGRAVGQALQRNRLPLIVPCHRVTGSDWIGGFSARGGISLKRHLLYLERNA